MIVTDVTQLPESAVKRILNLWRTQQHGDIITFSEDAVGWERALVRGTGAYKTQGDGFPIGP